MYIEQFYNKSLAEAAYFIESDNVAAVIDPVRETDQYIQLCLRRASKIKLVMETHFHTDFVSGHLDLARVTGARIVYGPHSRAEYIIYPSKDGEEFTLGSMKIRVIHTPGHSIESVCYLLIDENEEPKAVFTGDTLWIGGWKKPQIFATNEHSKEEMAGMLYDSVTEKLFNLPDDVMIFPGHGRVDEGKRYSTIGEEKRSNIYFQKDRNEFIATTLAGLDVPTANSKLIIDANHKGYIPLREQMSRSTQGLSIDEIKAINLQTTILLDVRQPEIFANGFISGSINIGLDGPFENCVVNLLDSGKKIVLVTPRGREYETVIRLARIGYENVVGYLAGGLEEWERLMGEILRLKLIDTLNEAGEPVFDVRDEVRRPINGSKHMPISEVLKFKSDKNSPVTVFCDDGYKSSVAASLLMSKGYKTVSSLKGGLMRAKNVPVSSVG